MISVGQINGVLESARACERALRHGSVKSESISNYDVVFQGGEMDPYLVLQDNVHSINTLVESTLKKITTL